MKLPDSIQTLYKTMLSDSHTNHRIEQKGYQITIYTDYQHVCRCRGKYPCVIDSSKCNPIQSVFVVNEGWLVFASRCINTIST